MRLFFTVVIASLSLNAFGQVPDYVPQDGLVAWYPFDNGVTDISGNGFDGANNGAQIVASNFGNALLFDGANDYVEIPTNSSFESLVDELTLSAWFNKTNTSNGSIIAKRNFVGNPCGERHHFELTCMSDNSILFSASHNCIEIHTSQIQTEDDVFELNTWNHVALTYNNGSIQLYLNGVLILTHYEGYRELLPNGHWLNFGRIHRSGGTAFFNEFGGQIDESGIWGRALSAIEIASLFNTSTPIEGCTDGAACNYDSDADVDDDSCWYLDLLINGLDVDDYTNCWYDNPSIDLSVAQPLLSNVYSDNIEWTSGVIDGSISANITTDAPLQTTVYTISVTLDGYTCESSVNVNVEESCSEGCTDSAACNFNNIASFDDGSCDYSCCQGAECCGNGTVWDEVNYRCIVADITDTNFDGCTNLIDLMDVLSAYGDCAMVETNYSLSFDGIGDWVEANTINLSNHPFTIETWVKVPTVSFNYQTNIIDNYETSPITGDRWGIYIDGTLGSNTGKIVLSSFDDLVSNERIDNDLWHHIAVVRNISGEIYLYVDGILNDSGIEAISNNLDAGHSIKIGSGHNFFGQRFMHCTMSEIQVSASTKYNSDFIPECSFTTDPNSYLHYKFDNLSQSGIITDLSAYENHGTINGSSDYIMDYPSCHPLD